MLISFKSDTCCANACFCPRAEDVNLAMEDVSSCSSNLEMQSSRAELLPRGYQWELFIKAKEGNIIVCLETGCGKTLIAAMLLKELSSKFSSSSPCIAIFLVPTVMLVQQQANAIEKFTDLKVGQYNGQSDSMKWDLEKWNSDVYNLEVLVMTPQALLNILQHAIISFETIKVLVFDECHHCQKNHPYALIMEEFYFKMDFYKRPRILGMTASPVIRKGKSELQCTQDIHSLEHMLDAKIVTVEDRSELDLIVPSPYIQIKEYDKVYHSLDSWQPVMKIISNLKAKKNKQEGLGKICRDLEYCIEDLGLWFARHAASDDYVLEKDPKKLYKSTTEEEKDYSLEDLYVCLDQIILQGGYGDELGVDNLKPDLVSNKVASLVDVLVNFRGHSQLKCIIFVERVVAAKVLAQFLSKVLQPLRCQHIVGNHLKVGTFSRKHMSKTLSDFRSGSVDLLVATNVAEEGLDIQDCCLIVQFDMPKTLRSFIQSRGRARVPSSHYVILKDRKNITEEELLDTLIQRENFVIEKILQGNDQHTDSKSREDGEVYEVKSTGAIVNSHSSIQLLHHYCSKLPSDEFYHPQPSFVYVEEQYRVKCCLTLPSNACIRLVEGELCETKAAAKRAACLKACKILHLKGALTDHLLPPTRPKDRKDDTLPNPNNTKATMEELQEPVIPAVWFQRPTINSEVIALYAYRISFEAVVGDREYSNFALLLKAPLPEKIANLCETFQLRQGRAVFCKLETLKAVCLNSVEVEEAEHFQSTLFSVLLERNLEHSRSRKQLMADGPWYLLLPLKKDQKLSSNKDSEIDWERINKLKNFEGPKNVLDDPKSASVKVDDLALQFFNGALSIENAPGLLVRTIHNRQLYCIIEIFQDLHAESTFPNNRFKNYAEYFKSVYDYELVFRGQPLLKARFLREAHNFLLNRSTKGGAFDLSYESGKDGTEYSPETGQAMEEPERSIVELPPEICKIEYFGFYDDLVNAAVILPSLMHRIENILVASQFHAFLGSKFSEGSAVSVEKVLEATTTQKCLDYLSLERLELLGDSFLKYAISCNLFLVHEEADEGFLSMQRIEKVCNSTLFTLGKNVGLIEYIHDSHFDPKHWVAPCYPSKVSCEETKVRDLHGESSKENEGKPFLICNKRHRWMQRKTVADAIEALIGAYLEDVGEHAALAFMEFIGLDVAINALQIVKVQSLSKSNLSLIKRIDIKAIESLLSYSFKHEGILIEAFTHASSLNHLGKCYQRLEFLGDSVLDFLITQQLYRQFKDSKPGELTDLRSTIVCNESFARIVIEWELHSYLIANSVELFKCIQEFITSKHDLTGDWEGDKCPKVLGDILESLSGAILVDGGFNLSSVWQVFKPILQPLISARKIQFHPVRELQELCQLNRFVCKESLEKSDKHTQFTFKIHVKDQVVEGAATSKDKKSAKRQAALDALGKLKAVGYMHASRCKPLGCQGMPNMEDTLSKKRPIQAKKSVLSESSGAIITTDIFPQLLHEAGVDIDTIQDGMGLRNILEKRTKEPLKTDRSREETETETESEPERTPMAVIDHAFDSSFVSPSHATHYNTSSRLKAQCPVWAHLLEQGSYATRGGIAKQSTKEAPIDLVKVPSLDGRQDPCIATHFGSLHVNPPDAEPNLLSATDATSGRSRADLYEACARKGWENPSFTCSYEEGPPHDKRFTYEVALQLPHVGQVHCTGDSRKTTKAAMDSAAAELMYWLRSSGKL